MTVASRLQAAIAAGESFDWRKLRDDLDAEHACSTEPGERESLLALFKTLMDMAERIDITPGLASAFMADRRDSYHRLLLREAGAGGRCPVRPLDQITSREVSAGRMPEDDPLREAAILAVVGQHRAQPQAANSSPEPQGARPADSVLRTPSLRDGWYRLLGWLARSNRRSADVA